MSVATIERFGEPAARGGERLRSDRLVERSEKLVSHHARHLRAAGLASSRREGKMVMYSLTDVGRALLGVLEQVEVRA
jgi:DNA-binding transcriptional ArsR family regulator